MANLFRASATPTHGFSSVVTPGTKRLRLGSETSSIAHDEIERRFSAQPDPITLEKFQGQPTKTKRSPLHSRNSGLEQCTKNQGLGSHTVGGCFKKFQAIETGSFDSPIIIPDSQESASHISLSSVENSSLNFRALGFQDPGCSILKPVPRPSSLIRRIPSPSCIVVLPQTQTSQPNQLSTEEDEDAPMELDSPMNSPVGTPLRCLSDPVYVPRSRNCSEPPPLPADVWMPDAGNEIRDYSPSVGEFNGDSEDNADGALSPPYSPPYSPQLDEEALWGSNVGNRLSSAGATSNIPVVEEIPQHVAMMLDLACAPSRQHSLAPLPQVATVPPSIQSSIQAILGKVILGQPILEPTITLNCARCMGPFPIFINAAQANGRNQYW